MNTFKVTFIDDRKDSKTYREVVAEYTETAQLDGEAIESASSRFYSEYPEFDPALQQIETHCRSC